jgi:transposase
MSRNRFTDEFKRDAVSQVVDRGYAVNEVAERLDTSTKSLYTWKARLSKPAKDVRIDTGQSREIRRLNHYRLASVGFWICFSRY